MKTSVEKLEESKVKLTVTIPAEDVDSAIDGVYVSVANQVKIAGFRKGKAPRPVIDSHVGRDYILAEATEAAVNDSYPLAVDTEGIRPVESPKIDEPGTVAPGQEFTYVAEIVTRPEGTLTEYKDIALELPPSTASEREIDAQIDYMRERFAALEPVSDRGVQVEDFVLLSFVGKVDGEDYDGNIVDKYLYEMSRGLMPVEFDRELVGVEAGGQKLIEFPIPESSSNPDYVGKMASFDVTVHEIKEKVLPPIDDDFAGNVGGYDTVDDLRKDLREKMDAQKLIAHMQLKEREARSALAERLECEVPESMVSSRTDAMLRDFATGLEAREMTIEQYIQSTGVGPEQIRTDIAEQALASVREELALEALFRALDMDVTDEEMDAELSVVSGDSDADIPDMRERFREAGALSALREQVMQKKAMLWLLDHVEVTEKATNLLEGADATEAEGAAAKKPGTKKKSAPKAAKKPATKKKPASKAATKATTEKKPTSKKKTDTGAETSAAAAVEEAPDPEMDTEEER